ncbi:Phosphofurin acidic cluster sorting protein 2 [Eufriesea mexicana]|uniref:Phosphofurin acidic cluster sorting protein 2 n=1 Tax=Eufriesea mexicana TaxID=516756 RepID=A0A310S929_9HYME|nr:Phosphofurin acidic cluster sorting protein 2 [Eufriesea mexicana]
MNDLLLIGRSLVFRDERYESVIRWLVDSQYRAFLAMIVRFDSMSNVFLVVKRGVDRQSDDSSRRADSDSHPENWTDHEANDPPNYVTGSPPKSEQHNKTESTDKRSRLFTRDRGVPGTNKSKKHSLSVDLKPPADLNSSEVDEKRSLLHSLFTGGDMLAERGVDRQSDDSSRRADSDSHPENWTDHEANDPPNYVTGSPPKSEQHNKTESTDKRSRLFTRDRGVPGTNKSKKHSLSVDLKPPADLNSSEVDEKRSLLHSLFTGGDMLAGLPRKALVEQLSRVLPDDSLPDAVSLVSLADPGAAVLATRLQERNHRVLTTASPADIRATFTCLVTRIQKFCNSSAKPPAPIKVVIAGGDSFVNAVLRHYVDHLSFRPQNYLKFFVVPLGSNTLSKYLGSIDAKYSMLFGDEWKELLEREGGGASEGAARVSEYLTTAGTTLLLPIAEAMVTYRETDDSSQIFIPFINDVRVGCPDSSSSASVDLEESNVTMSGSPPSLPPPGLPIPLPGRLTPPSSPNVGQPTREGWEPVELQLDYWSKQTQGEKGKNTLRQAFRALHVQRLPPLGETPGHYLSMNYTTKEKKQKIMRLGKKKEKEKENEPKSQTVDGVTRLICSAKTHNIPLRVSIDGTEWYGVKFFQLSAQWQTHIKTFPIAMLEYNPQQQVPNPT